MTVEEALRLTAGLVVGISVLLAVFHSRQWLWLTGFVSLNLIQSAFTGTCPAKWFYEKLGLNGCCGDTVSGRAEEGKSGGNGKVNNKV